MDIKFYEIFQNKISIENSAFSLTHSTLTYEKITISSILINLTCISLSVLSAYFINYAPNSKEIFSSLLADSFSLSVGITGFLVAGFSLFFTMLKPETTYALLLIPNSETKESMFKSALLAFIKPFIFFIVLIIYNFAYKIIYPFINLTLKPYNICLYTAFKYFAIFFLVFFMIKSILELIYLIYNIYSFIMFVAKNTIAQRMLKKSLNKSYEDYLNDLEIQTSKTFESELQNNINK